MKYGKEIRKKKIKKKHVEMLGSNQRSCFYFVTTLDIFFFKGQRSSSAINLELAKHVQV